MSTCGFCGIELLPSRTGPERKWCSDYCRKQGMYSGVCVDCGERTKCSGTVDPPKRCATCGGRHRGELNRREDRRQELVALWHEGLTLREIADRMGYASENVVGVQLHRLRSEGYELPLRYRMENGKRVAA